MAAGRERRVPVIQMVRGLPLASSLLLLLLCCLWVLGAGPSLALDLDLLLGHWQVYRLLTFPLGHTALPALLLSLLLFPTLGWYQESQLGTVRYIHASALGALATGLLYLLLAGLGVPGSGSRGCGYTPIHLALLAAQHRSRTRLPGGVIPPLLLLALMHLVSSEPPFVLQLCGLLTGLAYSAGLFRRLELSERRLQTLQKAGLCRALEGSCLLCFIPAPGSLLELPVVHPAGLRHSDPGPLGNWVPGLWPSPPDSAPLAPGLGTGPSLFGGPIFEGSPSWDAPSLPLESPLWSRGDPGNDELLQAAIQASLQDEPPRAAEELRLSKSSVSSLRLQQLERMGFSMEQAVVALAATGRVEGAVSLLVEGQVGDAAQVTPAGRSEAPREGDPAPVQKPEPARP
ncbi:rhomboid domain-containing protein 3 isoform X1 [Sarcophilus harrisii]|uniref:Rhomboid domain containing 3 n=1 Tax=Sarcophilus harrisii TaxID=9305 RepID=A0A7N4NYK4_SARHA|nr:rhomboid domain-containing protein 3 isoform X1 [Sarcophilus harrisii]XP_031804714.1 rhomboid domain-containing protein 3 isoform X1 [Sarcophilus harrisii]XP_031804715.1 rhomboid domain-containing protein 3 isoform X1 [Sarcophilus harrisii]XP_031804716.1 rhomboid domain-containing protein 3 isoform X1 [Sarcophilus harrisii]XP_031804717.1 rhomboid domain-containing protein 3 isoform X1 [Sarcophilus harrisii]XP_031804718.1 rhomboid domain-containing protein 3 isoform X1 [Sarcophilus harrisii]